VILVYEYLKLVLVAEEEEKQLPAHVDTATTNPTTTRRYKHWYS
jgi:hypothetical protein